MRIKLPNFEEILQFVESDTEFIKTLEEAGRFTYDFKREASLAIDIELEKLRWIVSEIGEGYAGEPVASKRTHELSRDFYVNALYLHSHPRQYREYGKIGPSGGDMDMVGVSFENDLRAILKKEGKFVPYIGSMSEAKEIAKSKNITWVNTQAILGIDDDKNLGLIIYQPAPFFKSTYPDERKMQSQDLILESLREAGFKANFLKYSKVSGESYKVVEKR